MSTGSTVPGQRSHSIRRITPEAENLPLGVGDELFGTTQPCGRTAYSALGFA